MSVADRVDQLRADVEAAEDLTEEDPAFGLEAERLRGQLDLASTELTELLAPSDPLDQEDALVEIHSGEGGEESASLLLISYGCIPGMPNGWGGAFASSPANRQIWEDIARS
ncbi:peptide chain release factor 1 [Cutibacterium acnes JCM 18918]|nr:peptide chain release factor 1 [Cutibacterium acnes JCM 18918]